MVQPLAELGQALVVFSNLDPDRALSHAGQHVGGLDDRGAETVRDGVASEEAVPTNLEIQSAQPGMSQNGGVDCRVVGELLESGGDVAANLDDLPIGSKPEELGFAARAAGGHGEFAGQIADTQPGVEAPSLRVAGRPFLDVVRGGGFFQKRPIAVDKHLTGIFAFGDGAEGEAGRQFRGQILQAVHREVGLLLDQCHFEFLGEQALGQRLARLDALHLQLVAGGLHDLDFERQFWECLPALVENHIGLSQREGTAPCGDDDVVGVEQGYDGFKRRPVVGEYQAGNGWGAT